jgi:hypothetical protein
MKKPRNMTDTPKGDWAYRQPETDMPFREQHPKALEAAVFEHRLSLPGLQLDTTGGWQARLWHDICQQNEYLDCVDTEDPGRYPNLADVWNWVLSMNDWRKTGLDVVTQQEAESRAAICVKCPHNKVVAGCFGCHGVGEAISNLIGGKKTSLDANLHQCGVCNGCMLGPKVFLPLEVIRTETYQDKLPSFCWLKK